MMKLCFCVLWGINSERNKKTSKVLVENALLYSAQTWALNTEHACSRD